MHYRSSNFSILFEHKQNTYIYNTHSGAIANISGNNIHSAFNTIEDLSVDISSEPYKSLVLGGFIVPFDTDELSEIRCDMCKNKFKASHIDFSICLSYECNLSCSYCFEKNWVKITSSTDIDSRLLAYLQGQVREKETKRVSINWSGGEPMLFLDRISKTNSKLSIFCKEHSVKYRSTITTNLTLCSPEICDNLRKAAINTLQVTLDGHRSIHDKYRISHLYPATYDLILENISMLCEYVPSLTIVLRINVSRENFPTLPLLIKDLAKLNLKNRIRIAFARLRSHDSKCFSVEEYAHHEIVLYRSFIDEGWSFNFKRKLTPRYEGCAAYTKRSYAICPDLSVLKCWELASSNKHKIGRIEEKGKMILNGKESTALALDPLDNQDCRDCIHLPLCMGGCAVDRSTSTSSDNCDMRLGINCNPIKYNLIDIIKAYIDTDK